MRSISPVLLTPVAHPIELVAHGRDCRLWPAWAHSTVCLWKALEEDQLTSVGSEAVGEWRQILGCLWPLTDLPLVQCWVKPTLVHSLAPSYVGLYWAHTKAQ